jgi:hypothetical protein
MLIRQNAGAANFSSAVAFGWQDNTTNRTVTVAVTLPLGLNPV